MVVILTSLRWLTVLVTIVLSVLSSTSQAYDSSACDMGHVTQYVTTFLAPGPILAKPEDLLLRLTVINPRTAPKVKITVDPSNNTFTLAPGETRFFGSFTASEALIGSKKHPRGGRVVLTAFSEDEAALSVAGSVKCKNANFKSFSSFTVLPTTSLGLDYVIVTHCQQNHCFLGIVATQNQTRVNVTLRLRSYDDTPGFVDYNDKTYESGDVMEEVLDPFQAMQVLCYVCDMSGSRVTASFPVAVMSGGELTMIGNSNNGEMDSLLEFLPPTDALGTRHVVAKITGSEVVVKVVAVKKGTIISALDESYRAENDGDSWTRMISENDNSFLLNSTLPVLVTLLHSTSYRSQDGSMTLLTPLSQWGTESYEVIQHFGSFQSELVIAGVNMSDLWGCLKIDDSLLSGTSTDFFDAVHDLGGLAVISVPFLDGFGRSKRLWCDSASCDNTCKPFWGYLHSWKEDNFGKGFAMPLGIFRSGVEQQPREVPANCSHLVSQETTAATPVSSATPVATETYLQVTSYDIALSSPLPEMTSLSVEAVSSSSLSSSVESDHPELNTTEELKGFASTDFLPLETSTTIVSYSNDQSPYKNILSTNYNGFHTVSSESHKNILSTNYNGLYTVSSESHKNILSTNDKGLHTVSSESHKNILSTNYNGLYTVQSSESHKNILSTNYNGLYTVSSESQETTEALSTHSSVFITAVLTPSPVITEGLDSSSAVDMGTTSSISQVTTALQTYHTLEMDQSTLSQTIKPRDLSSCSCRCQRASSVSFSNYNTSLLLQTARQRNRKQSAPDNRLSAIVIGSSGVFLLVGFALIIVCSDCASLLSSWCERKGKTSSRVETKTTRKSIVNKLSPNAESTL